MLKHSFNVSAQQLVDPTRPAMVRHRLDDGGVAAERLPLELPETVLLDQTEVSTEVVKGLVECGAGTHVDDFGTGYSSFDDCWRFTFYGPKTDRSYVPQLGWSDFSG